MTPGRVGVVTHIYGAVDQEVRAGQTLAALSSDQSGADGSLLDQERAQIAARLGELDLQLAQNERRAKSDYQNAISNAGARRDEIAELQGELSLALERLRLGQNHVREIEPLIAEGYVSKFAGDNYLQQTLSLRESVNSLRRQIREKQGEMADALASETTVTANAAAEASQLRAAKSALLQSLAELGLKGTLIVTAPISGRIAAVNAKAGDNAEAGTPLFAIAPEGGPLEAELIVPTRAAGFSDRRSAGPDDNRCVSVGAFWRTDRHIDRHQPLADHGRQVALPLQPTEPSYRVTASIDGDSIRAYGQARALRPGMTMKAFIETARLSFIEWLLEPLLTEH